MNWNPPKTNHDTQFFCHTVPRLIRWYRFDFFQCKLWYNTEEYVENSLPFLTTSSSAVVHTNNEWITFPFLPSRCLSQQQQQQWCWLLLRFFFWWEQDRTKTRPHRRPYVIRLTHHVTWRTLRRTDWKTDRLNGPTFQICSQSWQKNRCDRWTIASRATWEVCLWPAWPVNPAEKNRDRKSITFWGEKKYRNSLQNFKNQWRGPSVLCRASCVCRMGALDDADTPNQQPTLDTQHSTHSFIVERTDTTTSRKGEKQKEASNENTMIRL